ncbi:MAG: hypothetical protein WBA39_22070 [Rivularia sp. (in: cyanobacteria)]
MVKTSPKPLSLKEFLQLRETKPASVYCLSHGYQLGWLVDPDDKSILVFLPNQQPKLFKGSDKLTVLDGIKVELTAPGSFRLVENEKLNVATSLYFVK